MKTRRSLAVSAMGMFAVLAVIAATMGGRGEQASAAAPTLVMSPATQTLGPDQEFTITVSQNADIVTTGASAEINFTPGLLALVDVAPGAAYPAGDANFAVGTSQTKAEAIAEANTTGKLKGLSAYFIPGTGSVPPGAATAFTLTFRTSSVLGGTSPITFTADSNYTLLLDAAGALLSPVLTNATISAPNGPTVTPSVTPTATNTFPPAPTFTLTATPTVTITPGGPTLTPSPTATVTGTPTNTYTPLPKTPATMGIDPATLRVPPAYEFTLNLVHNAAVETKGMQADIKFDRTLLELLSVEKSAAYEASTLVIGGTNASGTPGPTDGDQTLAAIEQANQSTGVLENLTLAFTEGSVPAGPQTAFILRFKSKAGVDGKSDVDLQNCFYVPPTTTPTPSLTPVVTPSETATATPTASSATQCTRPSLTGKTNDDAGNAIEVTASKGQVEIDPDAPTLTPTATATGVTSPTVTPTLVVGSTQTTNTVAGSTTSPSGASGLPNAGSWFAPDGQRSLILGISAITLLSSLIALANTWIRRRRT